MQNTDFNTRITSHYWSQSTYFFVFSPPIKTATLAPELEVSICSRPHFWFCAFTTATLRSELIVSMGPRPHLSFCARKTATFGSELQVYGSQTSPVDF